MKISSDDVYQMILLGEIHVNLCAAPLAEPGLVQVFSDAELAAMVAPAVFRELVPKVAYLDVIEGTRITWGDNAWEITNVDNNHIYLIGERSNTRLTRELFEKYVGQNVIKVIQSLEDQSTPYSEGLKILNEAEPNESEEAERRLEIILPYLNGEKVLKGAEKERSIRRYIAKYKEAQALYENGLVGLLADYSGRGNSGKRLPGRVYEIMDYFIEHEYETLVQKGKYAVWGLVLKKCEEEGIKDQPSYPTFCTRVDKRPRKDQIRKRKGRRAAYKHEEFIYWIEQDTPRNGDRPFHIAHADHTKLDIELVCPYTGENLGRPWASFLIDAYSRRLLAIVVTFDPPSYRSVMMLIRECMRRHHRMPQIIVVDGGREFDSKYFRRLASALQITIKIRPAAKPRFGSVGERIFGIANKQFVHLLMGNTQIMTYVRQVTKTVNPKELAVWTLGDFNEWFTAWGYEFYDKNPHWTLKQTPFDAYTRAIKLTGMRKGRLGTYDETFRILTMPTTAKGTAKNVVDKGVKVNNIYYKSPELRDREIEGKQLIVRYDPFDISNIYVRIKGKWVRCLSEHYTTFQYCTQRQLKIASQELRKKDEKLLKGRPLSAKQLADFITSAERVQTRLARNRLLKQRLHDREFRPLMRFIDSQTGEQYFAPRPSHQQALPPSNNDTGADQDTATNSNIDFGSIGVCEDL